MTDKNNAMPMEFSKLGNELSKKFELGFSAEILYNKVAEKITAGKQQTVSPNDVYSFMLECKTLKPPCKAYLRLFAGWQGMYHCFNRRMARNS